MKTLLFIQGGGNGGYEADKKVVSALTKLLSDDYKISYPKLKTDENEPDFGWLKQIGKEIKQLKGEFILAGHSLGASMLLKYLSENRISKKPAGIFLLATPFWSGDENWKQGLKLPEDFAKKLRLGSLIFFYHCRDDEEIPFENLAKYQNKVDGATFREIESGGHQFDKALEIVARDIKEF